MAVTITDTRTVISDAQNTTGWVGSNTVNVITAEPTPVHGTACLGMVVSTATQHAYFTMGAAVNMGGAGTLVYAWVFPRGEMDTTANGGIQLILGDGTNRIGFHLSGSDRSAFRHDQGPVGWQCLVLDTANLPTDRTAFAGNFASLNLSAITQVGVAFKTLVKSVGGTVNCFWDILRHGKDGLIVTGGTAGDPGKFSEIVTLDRASATGRAYGVIRELGAGVFGVQAPISFGNAANSATFFEDENSTIIFEERGITNEKYGVTIRGTATTLDLNNCLFQAPPTRSAFMTMISGANAPNTVLLNNTQVVGFKQGVTLSLGTVTGCIFRDCGQVNTGPAVVRGTAFNQFAGTTGALLWQGSVDVRNSSFGGNSRAIQHTTAGEFTYDALSFSGNTSDVHNSSTGEVIVNAANGANPGSFVNTNGGTVVINNPTFFTFTVLDSAGNSKTNYEWRLYEADPTLGILGEVELAGEEYATSPTQEYTYNYSVDTDIVLQILHIGFEEEIFRGTLTNNNQNVTLRLTTEENI